MSVAPDPVRNARADALAASLDGSLPQGTEWRRFSARAAL